MASIVLASIDSRETLRCTDCGLVQFPIISRRCRRCQTSLDEKPEPTAKVVPISTANAGLAGGLAVAIKSLRASRGLSQRKLALRIGMPRSWISKIESERTTPCLESMKKLAQGLGMSVPELLDHAERPAQQERCRLVTALMGDQFMAEILPVVGRLSSLQRTAILSEMRNLSLKRRAS